MVNNLNSAATPARKSVLFLSIHCYELGASRGVILIIYLSLHTGISLIIVPDVTEWSPFKVLIRFIVT